MWYLPHYMLSPGCLLLTLAGFANYWIRPATSSVGLPGSGVRTSIEF